MMTDPIGDLLTRIRNAQGARKITLSLPYSKMKFTVADILAKEGYINKTEKVDKDLRLELKYDGKRGAITSIKRISKPGRRLYASYNKLPLVLNNMGIAIISTSRGIMTNKEARKRKLGGEILCEIY